MNILFKNKLEDREKSIEEYKALLSELKEKQAEGTSQQGVQSLQKKIDHLKLRVEKSLTVWDRIKICRHPARPKCLELIGMLCDEFHELKGDRHYSDDTAVITGSAVIDGQKVMIVAQEKGHDTQSRVHHQFGMMHPEGYRKALRIMKLAEKFSLPVVCLIDTPGANPTLGAEERNQGEAIARNLLEMSRLKTPILAVVVGEGCSGGALGIGVADHIAMFEHAYYSVISPEGCSSILWKDSSKVEEAAKNLKLQAEELLKLNIIDEIIKEPLGGAHLNKDEAALSLKKAILGNIQSLLSLKKESLLDKRYAKYRSIGEFISK